MVSYGTSFGGPAIPVSAYETALTHTGPGGGGQGFASRPPPPGIRGGGGVGGRFSHTGNICELKTRFEF